MCVQSAWRAGRANPPSSEKHTIRCLPSIFGEQSCSPQLFSTIFQPKQMYWSDRCPLWHSCSLSGLKFAFTLQRRHFRHHCLQVICQVCCRRQTCSLAVWLLLLCWPALTWLLSLSLCWTQLNQICSGEGWGAAEKDPNHCLLARFRKRLLLKPEIVLVLSF